MALNRRGQYNPPRPRVGYAYVYSGQKWAASSDEAWDTDAAINHGASGFAYQGQRRIDGVTVDVWKREGLYYAQTAFGNTVRRAMNNNPRANPETPCSTCAPDVFAANPMGGGTLLLLAAGAGALLWFLWPKEAAASTPSPGLPPGGPATCPLSAANLDAWGAATGVPVVYLPLTQNPAELTPAYVAAIPGLAAVLETGNVPVIVLGDGSFWTLTFATGLWLPAPAPAQKDLYCNWVAAQGSTAPPPQAPTPAPSPVQQATQFVPNV